MERIEELHKKVDKVLSEVQHIQQRLFFGNGDSITTKVRVLEHKVRELQRHDDSTGNRRFTVVMALVSMFFSVVGGATVLFLTRILGAG